MAPRRFGHAFGCSRAVCRGHNKGCVRLVLLPLTSTNVLLGKLLTTPSRLLKLIIPLTPLDESPEKKDVEPLALLVHPHQPLSYLERLIQSELPTITNQYGERKVPNVYFRAEDSQQDEIKPSDKKKDDTPEDLHEDYEGDLEETKFDGVPEKTGKLGKKSTNKYGNLGDGSVESYSGLGREGPSAGEGQPRKFVRWSSSTEIGDFIRDAARGKEFAVEIEGAPHEIRIGVPSFNDRTHYLRLRLRKTASKIIDLAAVKKECDMLAHKGAQRWAMGGAGALVGYWYLVYRITFETDLGWDVMEPVTVRKNPLALSSHTHPTNKPPSSTSLASPPSSAAISGSCTTTAKYPTAPPSTSPSPGAKQNSTRTKGSIYRNGKRWLTKRMGIGGRLSRLRMSMMSSGMRGRMRRMRGLWRRWGRRGGRGRPRRRRRMRRGRRIEGVEGVLGPGLGLGCGLGERRE